MWRARSPFIWKRWARRVGGEPWVYGWKTLDQISHPSQWEQEPLKTREEQPWSYWEVSRAAPPITGPEYRAPQAEDIPRRGWLRFEPSGCAARCCLTPWALLSAANLGSVHTLPLSTPPSVSGQSVRAMGAWLCPPRFPKMLPLSAVSGPKTASCRSCAQAQSCCEAGAARDSPGQADVQWYPGDRAILQKHQNAVSNPGVS